MRIREIAVTLVAFRDPPLPDILPGALRFRGGTVPVPDGAGPGAEPDRDDTAHMRRFAPAFHPERGHW